MKLRIEKSDQSDLPEVLLKLQQIKRARHAYREFSDILGIDITEASKRNIEKLKQSVAQGASFLQNCLTEDSKPLSEKEQYYYKSINFLDPREHILVELVIKSLTLRHATGSLTALRETGNQLSPLRIRMAKGDPIKNRHTNLAFAQGSFNFFTIGVRRHKIAGFLDHDNHDIITIPLMTFFKELKSLADWLWVGPHYHNVIRNFHSNPIEFSGVRFSFYFDSEKKTRTYLYERRDGTRFSRTLKFEEEIYKGEKIAFALALEMIVHLRFIGGSFREEFLDQINNARLGLKTKTATIQKVMTLLMPPDTSTEAKLPNNIPLNFNWIKVHSSKAHLSMCTHHKELSMERLERFMSAVFQAGPDASYDCPLIKVINEKGLAPEMRYAFVKKLLELGAIPHKRGVVSVDHTRTEVTAVKLAVHLNYIDILELLLASRVQDSQFPFIHQLASPNHLEILMALVERPHNWSDPGWNPKDFMRYDIENWEMFSLLMKYGLRIHAFIPLILLEINPVNKQILRYLLEHCSQLSPYQQVILASNLMKTDNLAALAILMNRNLIDPDVTIKTGEHTYVVDFIDRQTTSTIDGLNLLHIAVNSGNAKAVKFLINRGVKPILSDNGMSCYDLALELDEMLKSDLESSQHCGNYPLSRQIKEELAKNKAVKKALARQGIKPNVTRKQEEQYWKVHVACVGVITGIDRQGNKVVVLGRKYKKVKEEYYQLSEFIFPGGLKDEQDENFSLGAQREVKEETGLDMHRLLEEGKATQRLLHRFKKVSADGQTLNHIEFYQFDLDEHINDLRVYPYDDLKVVRIIPIEDIQRKSTLSAFPQYCVRNTRYGRKEADEVSLLASNGVLIDLLRGRTTSQELDLQLVLENDGYGMLCHAARKGHLEKIVYCVEQAKIPLFVEDIRTSPLIEACKAGHYDAVCSLLKFGAKVNDLPEAAKESPLIYAIKAKQHQIIKILCCNERAIDTFALVAAQESGDLLLIDIVLKAFCKQLSHEISEYQVRAALYCAVQHHMEHYAWTMLPYFRIYFHDQADKLLILMLQHGYMELARAFLLSLIQQNFSNATVTFNSFQRGYISVSDTYTKQILDARQAAQIGAGSNATPSRAFVKAIQTVLEDQAPNLKKVTKFENDEEEKTGDIEQLIKHYYPLIISVYEALFVKQKNTFFNRVLGKNEITVGKNEITVMDIINAPSHTRLGQARDDVLEKIKAQCFVHLSCSN